MSSLKQNSKWLLYLNFMCLAGNGTIDYEEFCIIMRDLVTVAMEMEERIRTTFSTMDLDGDGKISHEELKKV